jgi:predicted AAA+ superfamily ATPase
MVYIHRILEPALAKYLTIFPAIGITGPRQSGKSTLLKHALIQHYQYVSFDDEEKILEFEDDPKRFMRQYANEVIFDEVQKVPKLFNAIKLAVDEDRDNTGKFILTGSSQFSMLTNITESLAGRIGLLNLLPFQYLEIPDHLREMSIYKGSYPEIVKRGFISSDSWYRSYITTYLEKDVRQISQIGNIRDFSRFIRLLAANAAQILNLSRFATDIGVAVSTIKNWISVLEASYIIFLLPPFYQNYGKRVVKSPKIYFYDTGLVAHLTGVNQQALFENGPMTGALFENYIVSEVRKNIYHANLDAQLYYLRTSHGVEVDLIIDYLAYKEFVEIKFNESFKPAMIKPMKEFMSKKDKGTLVYKGESRSYDSAIRLCHYGDFLSYT